MLLFAITHCVILLSETFVKLTSIAGVFKNNLQMKTELIKIYLNILNDFLFKQKCHNVGMVGFKSTHPDRHLAHVRCAVMEVKDDYCHDDRNCWHYHHTGKVHTWNKQRTTSIDWSSKMFVVFLCFFLNCDLREVLKDFQVQMSCSWPAIRRFTCVSGSLSRKWHARQNNLICKCTSCT